MVHGDFPVHEKKSDGNDRMLSDSNSVGSANKQLVGLPGPSLAHPTLASLLLIPSLHVSLSLSLLMRRAR